MPFPIPCPACNTAFALDEALFQSRVAGKIARFKCPACGEISEIDAVAKDLMSPLPDGAPVPERLLGEADFAFDDKAADDNEVTELSDEEVASLPPESLAAAKAQRPKPRPRLESKIDDELWVVSVKEGDDDQEIFESSLVDLIAAGKMPPDAIVWREGIDDWIPLADVPQLAKHLPVLDDKTGGFLGTGMPMSFGSNAERKSTPPPLPPKKRSYGSAKKKSYGKSGERAKPVALSPGFLFSVDDAESEPPAAGEPVKGAKAAPKPPLKAPRRAVTRDLDFSDIADEESSPSSATPALRDLTTITNKGIKPPQSARSVFAGLGSTDEQVLGPPSIDISDITGAKPPAAKADEAPTSGRGRESSAPQSKAGKKSGKSKSRKSKAPEGKRKAGGDRNSADAPRARSSATATDESAAKQVSEEQGSWFTPGRITVLLAIAAAAYFLFSRQMQKSTSAPVSTTASVSQAEPTTPPPEKPEPDDGPAPVPEPEQTTEPEPDTAAKRPEPAAPTHEPSTPRKTAAEKGAKATGASAPETPAATDTKATETTKPETKPEPKPAPKPASNSDAPPFDKAAAVSALNAAVAQASGCRQEGDPTGTARVVVTFAPSGRVTSANLSGPPFAGTRTGGCIASTMRRAKIPAFSGEYVTVAKSVVIR